MQKILNKKYIIPLVYFLAVAVCLFVLIPFDPQDFPWLIGVVVLTLPWSLITTFIVMGYFGLDYVGISIFGFTGIINAYLIYRFLGRKRR